MSKATTFQQAHDAVPAFQSYCESCGAFCGPPSVQEVEGIAGVDFMATWVLSSAQDAGVRVGMAVIGFANGAVASASFESSHRAAKAKFVGGAGAEAACQAERELAEAFALWPRSAPLAELAMREELSRELAQKLASRRPQPSAEPNNPSLRG